MPKPRPELPLAIIVQMTAEMVRAALEHDGLIPVPEAVDWLDELETIALQAICAMPEERP